MCNSLKNMVDKNIKTQMKQEIIYVKDIKQNELMNEKQRKACTLKLH